mmetsp:Transcript_33641/g.51885  ORF Transcript_33641/g.51885 Transcript_33641/m.51885 type:complete len:89 (+) Transcript_33641:2059-2325(+)
MHIAARYGHYLIVKYLVDLGANITISNSKRLNPRQFLEEVLVTKPADIAKIVKKNCKTRQEEMLFKERIKLQADTHKLLVMAEQGLVG